MDAPYHFYSQGWTTDQIPLDHLVNVPGVVVDISHKAATDVEAKPPATAVIGFGGGIEREGVRENADWFVRDFEELTALVT